MSGQRRKPTGRGTRRGNAAAITPSPDPLVRPSVGVSTLPLRVPVIGDSIVRVSLGPGPRAARAARRQARRRGRRRWFTAGIAVALVIALSAAWWIAHTDGSNGTGAQAATPGRSTVALQLIGPTGKAEASALLTSDASSGQGGVVLLPSALLVDVPGAGSTVLRDVPSLGGRGAAAEAMTDALGVTVDGSWTLTMEAFAALIDQLGGVSVDVDVDVVRVVGRQRTIVAAAGPGRLTGAEAAAYASYTAPGDVEQTRLARFSEVLQQVIAGIPGDISGVVIDLGKLGSGASATITIDRLAQLLDVLRRANSTDNVDYRTLPVRAIDTGATSVTYGVDQASALALVRSVFPPNGRDVSTLPLRVLVQNGVGTPGLGQRARGKLVAAGFRFVNGGNANRFGTTRTGIYVLDGTAANRARGLAVAAALGLAETNVAVSGGQSVADVVVVLGTDFRG
jgi:anionic cell wall polymer biosynthesis LytR-Cps2A-Psr (LCP) family protein